jgi:RNA polymerase sigma-70 factor (ECF subfamily)
MQKQPQSEMIREAFRYQSTLTSYAYGMLKDWSLAKDVVQDAFVVLIEKYAGNDPGGGVFPLAKQIVRFKVLEALRKRQREVSVEEEDLIRMVDDTLDEMVSEAAAALHERCLGALHECMSQLNATMKNLMVAFYWKRQSCEEIAKTTKRNPPSLRVTLMRTRDKLRDCMNSRLKQAEVAS